MPDTKQLTLPITGMTCANCVATVERNLKKLEGIETAVVNLSSERATVVFDPAGVGLSDLVERVERAGYGIATGEADLMIKRLADSNDAARLEKALAKLEGVLEASVSLTTERARVRYVPTIISQAEIRQAISRAGFEAVETGGEAEDAEGLARQHEIDEQRRLLFIGVVFTVPLFLFSMAMDFRAAAGCLDGSDLGNAGHVCLGHPGAVLCWMAVLCWRIQVITERLGQHGCADRHGLLGGVLVSPYSSCYA